MLSKGISAPFRIAVLTGFDELFGLAQRFGVDKYDLLFFRC
jgi:hypothetical protein